MRLAFLLAAAVLTSIEAKAADTVLVLPFLHSAKAPNIDWIGESLAETIRESLAGQGILALGREEREEALRRLGVRPHAPLSRATMVKLGEAVDASHVVYGQYEVTTPADGGKPTLRIAGRVADIKRIQQSPEMSELAALDDLAAVQSHLAWQILLVLAPKTAASEEDFRKARPAVRVDAVENYIRGLLAATAEQKIKLFLQAARLEPAYSDPAVQLGKLYVERKEYRFALIWLEKVAPTHSHFYEAQFLLGLCRYLTGDFESAETAFRRVSEAVPLNEVMNNLAASQSRRKLPEAVDNFRKAIEGDDSDPDYRFNLGYALWKRGQFEPAADSFRAALERNPEDTDATLMLGKCLARTGPRPGDPKSDGLERLKWDYEETAYRQLKAELETKR